MLNPMPINPFVPNTPFLYPLKTSKNVTSDVFEGYRKGALGTNELNKSKFYLWVCGWYFAYFLK